MAAGRANRDMAFGLLHGIATLRSIVRHTIVTGCFILYLFNVKYPAYKRVAILVKVTMKMLKQWQGASDTPLEFQASC